MISYLLKKKTTAIPVYIISVQGKEIEKNPQFHCKTISQLLADLNFSAHVVSIFMHMDNFFVESSLQ